MLSKLMPLVLLLSIVSLAYGRIPDCEGQSSELEKCTSRQRPRRNYVEGASVCRVSCYTQRGTNGGGFGPRRTRTRYMCQPGYDDVRASSNPRVFTRNCVKQQPTTPTTTVVAPVASPVPVVIPTDTRPPQPAPVVVQQACPPLQSVDDLVPRCGSNERSEEIYIDGNDICPIRCYTRRSSNGGSFGPKIFTTKYECRPGLVATRVNPRGPLSFKCVPDDSQQQLVIEATAVVAPTTEPVSTMAPQEQVVAPVVEQTLVPEATPPPEATPSPVSARPSQSPSSESSEEPSVEDEGIKCTKYHKTSKSSFRGTRDDDICAVRCYTRRSYAGIPFGPKMFRSRYTCCDGLEAKDGSVRFSVQCV